MQFVPKTSATAGVSRVRRTRTTKRADVPHASDAQSHPWAFGQVKRKSDPHSRGSHAGLEHITVELLYLGQRAGYADLHLHHNSRGLSIGLTQCLYTAARQGLGLPTLTPPEPTP